MVALSRGSQIVTSFSYSFAINPIFSAESHLPLAFWVNSQEWHFKQLWLQPDWYMEK
jgi:hypothetical protein